MSELLKRLCESWRVCSRGPALDLAEEELSRYCEVKPLRGGVYGVMPGGSLLPPLMFDAHIDEVGFLVTAVKDGFAKVAPCGGVDARTLPSVRVTVHGKRDLPGVFAAVPPHFNKNKTPPAETDELYIDLLSPGAAELVSPGDTVTFAPRYEETEDGAIISKSLDDRAGVAALITAAELLAGKELPRTVLFAVSDAEEVGLRGAGINAFALSPGEAVAVDVSFAAGPGIPEDKCGKPGAGVMIGVSPALDAKVTDRLFAVAAAENIPRQTEVMAGATSTDADRISLAGAGVPTGLCSIPLRNMHSPAEVADTRDIDAVARLLAAYALSGGAYRE